MKKHWKIIGSVAIVVSLLIILLVLLQTGNRSMGELLPESVDSIEYASLLLSPSAVEISDRDTLNKMYEYLSKLQLKYQGTGNSGLPGVVNQDFIHCDFYSSDNRQIFSAVFSPNGQVLCMEARYQIADGVQAWNYLYGYFQQSTISD